MVYGDIFQPFLVKHIALTFIIIFTAIIINIVSVNILVITCNLTNHFLSMEINKKTEDFFATSTENSQAATGEKTKCYQVSATAMN